MKGRLSGHKGRRSAEKKINKKKLFGLIICIAVLVFILIWFYNKKHKEEPQTINEPINTNQTENTSDNTTITEEEPKGDEIVDVSYLPDQMGGYTVIGELVIDKIDVRHNILSKTTDDSLDLSVTRFWGPEQVNEVGNFSITGHNFKGLLKRLNELVVGDTFYLVSKDKQTKVTYEIYDIYTCWPSDTSCIDPPAEENVREVTLITCTPGASKRLICKAREKFE